MLCTTLGGSYGKWRYADDEQRHRNSLSDSSAKRAWREVRCCLRGDGNGDETRIYGSHRRDHRPAAPPRHPRSHKRSGAGATERAGLARRRPMEYRRRPRAGGTRAVSLSVIPLAITMNAGPQIMSAIIFVTATKPLKLSAYFITGVVIAVTAGLTITYTLATLLGNSTSLGDSSDSGSLGKIIQYLLVGLLVFVSIRNYVRRETIEPPRRLGALQNATPRMAFTTGLLLSVFPSDLVILVTVGVNLAQNDASLLGTVPFIAATILIAALPVLSYLLFHRRAVRAMPKVRDWMNTNSWLVNIIVYVVFIVLILA